MRRRILAALVPALTVAAAMAPPSGAAPSVSAADDGLAQTPPMGWQSFKEFRKNINEDLIKRQADLMVESGLRDAGYDILIVDGGWRATTRDADGNMQAHPEKFPSGMKALGDYIHSKGLRFGLHQAVGTKDCAGADPGTQSAPGGEQQDAGTFASWGVDVLKYDLCQYKYPDDATPGAPDYDEFVLRKDGEVVGRYEAEAATTTGDTRADDCAPCSGGEKVTAVGFRDGTFSLPDVDAPAAGDYTLEIRYVNVDRSSAHMRRALRQNHQALMSVNGEEPTVTEYPIPTRQVDGVTEAIDWDTVDSVSVPVTLRDGANTLTFSNPRSWEDETRAAYQRMYDAVQATGRPIEIHISEYGMTRPWLWAQDAGHIWRIEDDLADAWDGIVQGPDYDGQGRRGIMYTLDRMDGLESYAGPGGWNDPNTIEAGLGHLTPTEYRSQFSLWALTASPLLMASDLREMSQQTKSIVLNREVIAVDQDPLGVQGRKIRDDGDHEVWTKPLDDGSVAVVLLNRGTGTKTMRVSAADELGLPAAPSYRVRDLWAHRTRTSGDLINGEVESHGVVLYRVSAGS